jgi:hypothetical protein
MLSPFPEARPVAPTSSPGSIAMGRFPATRRHRPAPRPWLVGLNTTVRPSATKRKLKYFGTPLLTSKAVKRILMDVQPIVEKLRGISGSKETLAVIPWPSFFDEEY